MPVQPTEQLYPSIFQPGSAVIWLALFLIAFLVDLMAGHRLPAWFPSLKQFTGLVAAFLLEKLDRPNRTPGALMVRGLLVLLIFLPLFFAVGSLVNNILPYGIAGDLLGIILLVPVAGFRHPLERMRVAGETLKQQPDIGSDPYKPARAAVASAVIGFSLNVPVLCAFALGGFALLAPFLFLHSLFDSSIKKRSGYPESPFMVPAAWLHELLAGPGILVSSLLLAIAHFFTPRTNLTVFSAFNPTATFGPASRYFPLKIISKGVGVALEADIGCESDHHKAFDRKPKWIGDTDARARLKPVDVHILWTVLLIATGLFLLLLIMVFLVLLEM